MSSNHNSYSVEEVRQILNEIVLCIGVPSAQEKLREAKEAAGNEMLRMMQGVFPLVVQLQAEVIARHGFAPGREGLVHFTQLLRDYAPLDPEIARLHREIRSHFLPPVNITSQFDNSI